MIVLYAVVGLLVGGVLNVLADILPHKTRLCPPFCPHCNAQRRPAVWLATMSYLLDRGRCAGCGERLPLRGVLTEWTTTAVFAFVYHRYGLTGHLILVSFYMAVFILVTVTDLEHRLILNSVILPAILLALIAGPFTPNLSWKRALIGGLIGFGFFYIVAILARGGFGAGDIKLAAFIGLVTGSRVVVLSLFVGVLAGGLVSLILLVTRIRSRRDFIPYGPFLVIGGVFGLFWGDPIMDSYLEKIGRAETMEWLSVQDERPAPDLTVEGAVDWSQLWTTGAS